MSSEQLWQVLGESGTRQHHVATDLVRFLLQIALHVREEANDGCLFQLALEFGNQAEWFDAGGVQVNDDE